MNPTQPTGGSSRRDFLKASAALAASAAFVPAVHSAGTETLKVGLIGCGGRGTGAAEQALKADPNVKLTAMGDAFADRLEGSLTSLKNIDEISKKIDVKDDHKFTGFDAYRKVIDSGVDVVLLCEPPHFRPRSLAYAIEKGKHVFAEKPIAVDATGVRSVLATCAEAKRKNLSVVSGLCLRYDAAYREAIKRVHEGAIGDLVALQCNDLRGRIWVKPRQKDWSDMTWQMRNWYYFTWLSGDFNVEQHVHMLDVASWAMKDEYPVKAIGVGGRQVRTGPEYGHIFDHFSVCYEYKNGQKLFAWCRQQDKCKGDISTHVMGSKGSAVLSGGTQSVTSNGQKWQFDGKPKNHYQVEHDELFASIRNAKPINNGEYMCNTTLLAILGRMVCYTGQQVTWEQAMNSKEDLSPPKYDWDVALQVPAVALPGITKIS